MKHFFDLLFHFKFRELMVEPTDDGFIQFFRFIFVGGSATLVDIFTGWLFVTYIIKSDVSFFGLFSLSRDVLSVAVGFLIGVPFIVKSIAGTLIAFIWNFAARKLFIYNKKPEESK